MIYKFKWQEQHVENIYLFLKFINNNTSDLILKGGTALLVCYGLDRFSEDIDLDGLNPSISIEQFISDFCKKQDYQYRISKDTDAVKHYMINYGNISKPLKIEISFRNRNIDKTSYTIINGLIVYNIDSLTLQKAIAYSIHAKIHDLYDLCFIYKYWWKYISGNTKMAIKMTFQYKGIDHFDYMIQTQHDDYINENQLANDFLDIFDKIGLLFDKEDIELINEIKNRNLLSASNMNKNNKKIM